MNIEVVGREIARFLNSPDPEVLCLKGKWGVGKTFAWGRYLQQARKAGTIALSKYAFVSLYGINSAEELRAAVVENTVPPDKIGQPFDPKAMLTDPLSTAKSDWRRALAAIRFLPGSKDINAVLQRLSFLAVRNQIITFDDLERKGDGLKLKEVLGLAVFLKEQRDCKVVLILNEGAFDTEENADFGKYFEKTVDAHVNFEPTAEEAVRIALPDNSSIHDEIRPHCLALDITNIRVIRRIERMARLLEPSISKYNPGVRRDYLKSLTLLGWSKYAEGAPDIEFLKARHQLGIKKEKSADELKWGATLQRFGLWYFSDTARIALECLERGFIDPEDVGADAQKLHAGYDAKTSESSFHEAWQIYHGSFDDNQKEGVEALCTSFRKSVKYIAPVNADGTVRLLRDLGENKLASELISLYVDCHEASSFDMRERFGPNEIRDKEFKDRASKKFSEIEDKRDPKQVLIQIAKTASWNDEDILLLSKISADGYYDIFKSIKDADELSLCIQQAQFFGQLIGAKDTAQTFAKHAQEALIKIGKESTLNKRRVEKFGIKVE